MTTATRALSRRCDIRLESGHWATRAPWLPSWQRAHARHALAITAGVVLVLLLFPAPPLLAQLTFLAVLLSIVGLPHGAADHLALRPLLRPQLGRFWLPVFLLGYVAIAAAVLVAWLQAPPILLAAFLSAAVLHFGDEDTFAIGADGSRLSSVLHGLIPVAGPMLFHPDETALLFAYLLPGTAPVDVQGVLNLLATTTPLLLLSWGLLIVSYGVHRRMRAALEVLVLVALMIVAPPLIGFAVYFCGWHAIRHILDEAQTLDAQDARRGIRRFAVEAFPVTLATIFGGVAAFAALSGESRPTVALTQVIFIGLAAVAVPHIVIRRWLASRKRRAAS